MQEKGLQLNILQGGEEDREEETQPKQIIQNNLSSQ
jgi:hypothetical protein